MRTPSALVVALAAAMLLLSGVAAQEPEPAAPIEPLGPEWTFADNRPCLVWNHVAPVAPQPFTWSGACVDGKASGEGVLAYSGPHHVYCGTRYRYEGGMKAGKRHGHGTLVSPSTTYEGEWRDGKENGYGTFTWRHSRTRYEGAWRNGVRHGYGIRTRSDGERYEGEWCLNYRHGRGTEVWEDGFAMTCDWYANGIVPGSCWFHSAPAPSAVAPARRTDFYEKTCSYDQVIAPLLR